MLKMKWVFQSNDHPLVFIYQLAVSFYINTNGSREPNLGAAFTAGMLALWSMSPPLHVLP
jgi:hypothetical protein